ncbi:MAG: hypothetical protein AAF591_19045 [Verrucomicrobiota bacterium]
MRAALTAICLVVASCGRNADPIAEEPSRPDKIEITGGALGGLQGADRGAVEMISLEPLEHADQIGLIYNRLQKDATKEITPPEGLTASEYITVKFPDGRGYYMITSSLLELNGKWYEGEFDYAMAGMLRYIQANTDFEWNEERLYSRYPSEEEMEGIRAKWLGRLQEKIEEEQGAGDQAPAAVK